MKKVKPIITNGGFAKMIGKDKYLVIGKSHKDGGVKIGNTKQPLEVEGGEVLEVKNNKQLRVFSAVPFLRGDSPANKILNGENTDVTFNKQEKFKKENGMSSNNKIKKIGGFAKFKTAFGKFKNFVSNNGDSISDVIQTGSNVISSIISNKRNNNMLNNLQEPPKPVNTPTTKLKTFVNINDQVSNVNRQTDRLVDNVNDNTRSSRVALSRVVDLNLRRTNLLNDIYSRKENMETQLSNQEALNNQRVIDKNINTQNDYNNRVVAFNNNILDKKSENDITLLDNVSEAIKDIISIRAKRKKHNNELSAIRATAPNVNDTLLKRLNFKIPGLK